MNNLPGKAQFKNCEAAPLNLATYGPEHATVSYCSTKCEMLSLPVYRTLLVLSLDLSARRFAVKIHLR
jgi:hypothetical protein